MLTKIPINAIQFTGSNIDELIVFGAQILKQDGDTVAFTDRTNVRKEVKKGEWVSKTFFAVMSVISNEEFQKNYTLK